MILKDIRKRIFTALVLLLIVTLIIKYDPLLLFFLIIFGIFSIVEFFNIIKKITKKKLLRLIYNLSFIVFIFIYCSLFF